MRNIAVVSKERMRRMLLPPEDMRSPGFLWKGACVAHHCCMDVLMPWIFFLRSISTVAGLLRAGCCLLTWALASVGLAGRPWYVVQESLARRGPV